jgi:hypothetical protein
MTKEPMRSAATQIAKIKRVWACSSLLLAKGQQFTSANPALLCGRPCLVSSQEGYPLRAEREGMSEALQRLAGA